MKHLVPATPSRTILPLLVINLMIAFAFLAAHLSDAEANHTTNADSDCLAGTDCDPFNHDLHPANVTPQSRRDAHYRWRHHGRHYSQGFQGKRVRQGYQGKRVRQGYQGRRVPQGYQFEGNPRRYGDRLRLRPSSPPAKRSPYARRSSPLWKRSTPFAKAPEKSLWSTPHGNSPFNDYANPATFGMGAEPNLNSAYINPSSSGALAVGASDPYGVSDTGSYGNIFGVSPKKPRSPNSSYIPFTSYSSNPYGMSNDDSQKDSSGTAPETSDWTNYSLIAPGWSGND